MGGWVPSSRPSTHLPRRCGTAARPPRPIRPARSRMLDPPPRRRRRHPDCWRSPTTVPSVPAVWRPAPDWPGRIWTKARARREAARDRSTAGGRRAIMCARPLWPELKLVMVAVAAHLLRVRGSRSRRGRRSPCRVRTASPSSARTSRTFPAWS